MHEAIGGRTWACGPARGRFCMDELKGMKVLREVDRAEEVAGWPSRSTDRGVRGQVAHQDEHRRPAKECQL